MNPSRGHKTVNWRPNSRVQRDALDKSAGRKHGLAALETHGPQRLNPRVWPRRGGWAANPSVSVTDRFGWFP